MSDKTPDSLDQIDAEVRECINCVLHIGRKNAVPGEGNTKARMVFVGEAPGREEDLAGRPFVGMAGKLLTQLLSSAGLRREDVFITNIVKCRPPENRLPLAPEIKACSNYLKRQIKILNPKLICPMGNVALRAFLGKNTSISKAHGRLFPVSGSPAILPLYHPAAALYMARLKRVLEDDFRRMSKETS
ncbi:MAG: uracil-DNA glycosylase [Promethearchaeati archaeon SRVP18_Atabeyarchaeia-1]